LILRQHSLNFLHAAISKLESQLNLIGFIIHPREAKILALGFEAIESLSRQAALGGVDGGAGTSQSQGNYGEDSC
jgi:hypothetical protein